MKLITLLLAVTISSVAIATPVMTKKINPDGTVTYDPVGDPKAGSPETVPQKLSKEIDKQAREVGVQVIDITSKPVMTKKVNSDGTITYDPIDPKADFTETVPKKKGKEVDEKLKELGVKVIDITPKSELIPKK